MCAASHASNEYLQLHTFAYALKIKFMYSILYTANIGVSSIIQSHPKHTPQTCLKAAKISGEGQPLTALHKYTTYYCRYEAELHFLSLLTFPYL
jgi:hypothetical protein